MVLKLTQCCCGCSLKTGTIIIAVLQALGGFSVSTSMTLKALRPGNVTVFSGRNHGLTDEEVAEVNRYIKVANPKVICIILVIIGLVQVIFSILLVYGANNENPKLIKPWMVFAPVMTLIMILTYVAFATLTFILGLEGVGAAILIGMVPASAILVYFIAVVYSFHSDLVAPCSPPCKV